MLALSQHGISVKGLFSPEGKSLGMALVQVSNAADAEKVRNHCSGQIIDASELLEFMPKRANVKHTDYPSNTSYHLPNPSRRLPKLQLLPSQELHPHLFNPRLKSCLPEPPKVPKPPVHRLSQARIKAISPQAYSYCKG
jgi:hypothetical protein